MVLLSIIIFISTFYSFFVIPQGNVIKLRNLIPKSGFDKLSHRILRAVVELVELSHRR